MTTINSRVAVDELIIPLDEAINHFPCIKGVQYKLSDAAVKELSTASISSPDADDELEDKVPMFAEPSYTMIKDGKVNCTLFSAHNEYIGHYQVSTEDLIYVDE